MSGYSQWNQDTWVYNTFFRGEKGYFVDVGAHDGKDISNTLFFEEKGWDGLCIEPIPEVFERLRKNRKCDVFQGCAYDKDGTVLFTRCIGYTEMLSGISDEYDPRHTQRINREMSYQGGKKKEIKVECRKLSTICDRDIDYLSIDTEGSELKVLKGINWNRKIRVVEVENNYERDEVKNFLSSKGYVFVKELGGDDVYIPFESLI